MEAGLSLGNELHLGPVQTHKPCDVSPPGSLLGLHGTRVVHRGAATRPFLLLSHTPLSLIFAFCFCHVKIKRYIVAKTSSSLLFLLQTTSRAETAGISFLEMPFLKEISSKVIKASSLYASDIFALGFFSLNCNPASSLHGLYETPIVG